MEGICYADVSWAQDFSPQIPNLHLSTIALMPLLGHKLVEKSIEDLMLNINDAFKPKEDQMKIRVKWKDLIENTGGRPVIGLWNS